MVEQFRDHLFLSDSSFNRLYEDHVFQAAQKHWTPLEVARKVATYLDTHDQVKILDIGSGAGKFCLTAAHYQPRAQFYGVEQRSYLVDLCNNLKAQLELPNVEFIHGNITDVDLNDYDHFYFYNSFYENIEGTQKIDYEVPYSEKLYDYYNLVLYKKLKRLPSGTRIATYHSFGSEMPDSFQVVQTDFEGYLKFWVKV